MKTNKKLLAQLALLAVAVPAFAQTTYYLDNNGATNGFGALGGTWSQIHPLWTNNAQGTATTTLNWNNDASPVNNAVLDYTGGKVNDITLTGSLNIGNLTVQNFAASITTTSFISTATTSVDRTITLNFGSNSTLDIGNATTATSDFGIRSFQSTVGATNQLNVEGGFNKSGIGVLQFQTFSNAGTANIKISGIVNVQNGGIALFTNDGTSTTASRTIDVSQATFALSANTFLATVNALSATNAASGTGMAKLGIVTGTGTIRGDAATGNTLTYSATGLQPGEIGTIGTLNIADNKAATTSVWNNVATIGGNTAFTFADIAVGGLKFDLAAPGSSDKLAFSGLTSIDLAGLNFNQFEFNTLSGFGTTGSYTLMEGLTSIGASVLGTRTGTIGGLDAVLSLSGTTLELNVSASAIPEPATYAALVGLGILGFVVFRRRGTEKATS